MQRSGPAPGLSIRNLLPVMLLGFLPAAAHGAATPAAGPETFLETLEETDEMPGFQVRAGLVASDNVTRLPDPGDGNDEIVTVAELGANWHSVGTRFAAALDGTLAYHHYTQNDFDDEGRANFFAIADYFIIPETLDWYISDRLANAPVDPLGTTSPINVQFVNVLETGPRLTLRPGGSNELTFAVSRADIQAEETPIDHERNSGSVSFLHGLSANSTLGLVADVREVTFADDANATDFDQEAAHLEYDSRNDTMRLWAAAGVSSFELADGLTREGTTGWLRLRARRTSDSVIYVALERTANDTATELVNDEVLLEQGGISSFIVTGDPFFSQNAVVRYTRGWRAHEWFIALNTRDIDYFISPLDRDIRGARLGARFALSARVLLSLTAASSDIEYNDIVRSDTVRTLFAEADYRLGRNWSIVTGARYLERDSDHPAYAFDETMLSLFVNYAPRWSAP